MKLDKFVLKRSSYITSITKHILDLIISFFALPFVLPAVVVGMLLLSIPLGTRVFFVQTRVGKNQKPFSIYKLRTLRLDTNNDMAGMSLDGDDFVLFGRWLRRWRIDEFPQILNVLKGEMSWIGPRPERPHLSLKTMEEFPNFHDRCIAKPGITGWAQVHLPNATPRENGEKLRYDLEYVERATLYMDFTILFKTIRAVV